MLAGWSVTPIIEFLAQYIFSDWHFVFTMVVLVSIDLILGVMVASRRGNISSEKFSKTITKVLIYMLLLIATHIVSSFKVNGEINSIFSWLDSLVYSTIMVREFLSIVEKTAILGVFKLPNFIKEKLEIYGADGEIKGAGIGVPGKCEGCTCNSPKGDCVQHECTPRDSAL